MVEHGLEERVLDLLLAALKEKGLVKAGGKQRTDSTHVLVAVRELNRLELAGETVRAALEALSAAAPDWAGTVGAGALHAEAKDLAERGCPQGELFVAATVGRDTYRAVGAADDVDGTHCGVHVLVGVDPDDDFPDRLGLQDAGHGCRFPSRDGGQRETVGRAGGQDCDECLGQQAPDLLNRPQMLGLQP